MLSTAPQENVSSCGVTPVGEAPPQPDSFRRPWSLYLVWRPDSFLSEAVLGALSPRLFALLRLTACVGFIASAAHAGKGDDPSQEAISDGSASGSSTGSSSSSASAPTGTPAPDDSAAASADASVAVPDASEADPSVSPPAAATPPENAAPYPPCTAEPDEQATIAAKGAFEAGNAAFNEADYQRAITYWEDAYRRDCTAHPMLKNLARAYELDGQLLMAIIALQTYLERQPNTSDTASIERRIGNLKRRLEEDDAKRKPAAVTPKPATPTEPPPPPPKEAPKAQERSVVPLVVAGVGGVAAAVGGVFWFDAKSTLDDIDERCPDRSNCPLSDEGNDARSDVTLFGIVAGVGAAVAVGGMVWYFAQPEESPALSAEVGPGYAGLEFRTPLDL